MRFRFWLALPLTLLGLGSRGQADAVHLVGGQVLEGSVTVEDDKVTVAMESGRVSVPRASVIKIEEKTPALELANQREAALAPGDVAGLLALANYCREQALYSKERALLERIVALLPEHPEARRRLGYVRSERGWVSASERRERAAAAQDERRERAAVAQHERRERAAVAQHERQRARAEADARRQEARSEAAQRQLLEQAAGNLDSSMSPYPFTVAPIYLSAYPAGERARLLMPPARLAAPRFGEMRINGVRDPRSYLDEAARR